jgi:hemolysin III
MAAEAPGAKPRLRGVLHQWAACAALGSGAVLVSLAEGPRVAGAVAAFAGSLVALFVVSAVYHRVNWSPAARARMRRLDHASIFVLIAGTYTPIAVLALPPDAGRSLLLAAWAAALLGILQSLLWIRAPKAITALLAVAVGWTIIPYLGPARASLSTAEFALIATGGLAYTAGAIAYALKRPNPWPGVLGYHEVFHALTIVGAALHFAAVVHLVRVQRTALPQTIASQRPSTTRSPHALSAGVLCGTAFPRWHVPHPTGLSFFG